MNAAFYTKNRYRLTDNLEGGLVVASAYLRQQNSNDAAHDFLQEANFLWLTGIEEAGWKVIIDGARKRTTLVSPVTTAIARIFDGGLDAAEALTISGADEVITKDELEPFLRDLAQRHKLAYTVHDTTAHDFVANPASRDLKGVLDRIFPAVQLCNDRLAKCRALKQPEEIAAIKQAIGLTVHSFTQVKQALQGLSFEYEAEALFGYEFRMKNAVYAYGPIVARGGNACTLHYGKNADRIKSGQLVLMDVGARVKGYAADITRTYAKGKATKRQSEVHQAVEAAHYDIVKLLRPGVQVKDYLTDVDTRMKQALMELGLLKDMTDETTYRRYFPHAISHGLGIDVHDSLGAPRQFEENMILTVEPGIYIPEEKIGVRIEDDILITATGNKNLSEGLSTGL